MKIPFQVVYEDNHLLIVNKANGLLVQGDKSRDKTLLDYGKTYIKEKYGKPGEVFLGLAHRLDRPVSGLVVLCRTSKSLERMTKMFRERKIQKIYWAVVKRRVPEKKGKLVHWLEKNEDRNKVQVYDFPKDGAQKAELKYRLMGTMNDHKLIEVEPITGRPHQIRAQLGQVGAPIRGDVKYGFPKANLDASIHLHARKLFFNHPVKKEPLVCVAAVPETQFWEQFLVFDPAQIKEKNVDNFHS